MRGVNLVKEILSAAKKDKIEKFGTYHDVKTFIV